MPYIVYGTGSKILVVSLIKSEFEHLGNINWNIFISILSDM